MDEHWLLVCRFLFLLTWHFAHNLRTKEAGRRAETLEDACVALLREVLTTASLCPCQTTEDISILDVGFGCGDQTWELAWCLNAGKRSMFRYVGITDNPKQVAFAQRRLDTELAATTWQSRCSFKLFRDDGAQPDGWEEELRGELDSFANANDAWLLGLDCLYHFSPSRKPLFEYAARNMHANLMAFDLLLQENASLMSRAIVWCICKLIGCPTRTFLTKQQYAAQLEAAGYAKETIILRDISSDVFPGFVAFMDAQEQVLAEYGIKLGALKVAKRIFGWFGTSGAIRAVIVVARVPDK